MFRLGHRYLHRCGAVVRGVRLAGHRVHARPVVVRPRRRRRRQSHGLAGASRSGKPGDRVGSNLRVRGRDGRVRRPIVAQRRRRRFSLPGVRDRRRQRERRTGSGIAVAHRRRGHRQVGIALGLRHGGQHRDLHGCGAVVRGVQLVGHGVHARTVVVRSRRRRRRQLHRCTGASRSGKPGDGVGSNLRVRGRDGRVRRAVVAQGRRRRFSLTGVRDRRRQRERRTGSGIAVAHRWRCHHQIRTVLRVGQSQGAATCERSTDEHGQSGRSDPLRTKRPQPVLEVGPIERFGAWSLVKHSSPSCSRPAPERCRAVTNEHRTPL